MKRQLDADGFDITDDVGGKGNRLPVIAVGVASAAIITASVGMVALAGDDSEHVARAADATIVTALGHTVTGDRAAVDAALPLARAALDGSIQAPAGLPEGETDVIPPRMLEAYRTAEAALASESPGCSLPWWILAGIGKVESNHAAGGRVDAAGTTTVRIVGPRLDGTAVGGSVVTDSDKGSLDGDLTFDRGVGPMLMLPGTWGAIGRDGNGDGTADVSNADDAALAVGTVLCSAHADLSTPEGLAAGLAQIDDTPTFASDVLPWAAHYRTTSSSATGTTTGGATASAASTPTPTQTGTTSTATVPVAGPGFTTLPIDAPPTTTPPPAATPAPSPTRRPSPPATTPAQRSPRTPADGSTPPRTPVKPGTPTRTPVTPTPTSPTRTPTTPPARRPVPSDPPPEVPSDPPSEDPIVPPREDPPAPPPEGPGEPPREDPDPTRPPREDPADPPGEGPGDDDGKRKGKDDDRRDKKGKKGKDDDRRDKKGKKGKKGKGGDESPIVDD